jgi:hypothetical protein
MTLATRFYVLLNDEVVAVLDICEVSEMFWQTCALYREPRFEEIEERFAEATRCVDDGDMDGAEAIWQELSDRGVRLLPEGSQIEIESFILHISGDTVELRYVAPG